ncbi:hypothetical protein [Streptomyces sp. NPDC002490]|uniref:hypothetical protein n=1 Tax=Streptomyces sp. NPDC002490 TaxID=3154416 RepID=UPI003319359F
MAASASSSPALSPEVEEKLDELFEVPPEEPEPDTADEYPDTGKSAAFDAAAVKGGWVPEGYEQAAEYVLMMCESMDAWRPGVAQTLVTGHVDEMTGAMRKAMRKGVGRFCPDHGAAVREALAGKASVRTMGDGTYEIVARPGFSTEDGELQAPPGTYRVEGDLEDCYWERARRDGSVIDNGFVTAAREVTVTVRVGELFTARNCGGWVPVR